MRASRAFSRVAAYDTHQCVLYCPSMNAQSRHHHRDDGHNDGVAAAPMLHICIAGGSGKARHVCRKAPQLRVADIANHPPSFAAVAIGIAVAAETKFR